MWASADAGGDFVTTQNDRRVARSGEWFAERWVRHGMRRSVRTGLGLAVCGALLVLVGSCWRPRSNTGRPRRWRAPGWESGPLAGASARAGAVVQVAWDGDGPPVSIVAASSDPDGQELTSDLVSEDTLEEFSERLSREPPADAGLDVTRLVRLRPELCLQILDGSLAEGRCPPAEQ